MSSKTVKKVKTDTNQTKKNKSGMNIKTFVSEFKINGIKLLQNSDEAQLSRVLQEANKRYYNDTPIFSDSEYDIIREYVELMYPDSTVLNEIGAPITKDKIKLPYFMASMDKIKPTSSALTQWQKKHPSNYVISAKLDGVSGMYSTESGVPKLYTRGNGRVGQDITHLIPYLNLPSVNNITIRGEFIIEKSIFDLYYKSDFSNPRNFVSGIINSKKINSTRLGHVDFVAYEVIMPQLTPSDQFKLLHDTLHVDTVLNTNKTTITNDTLSEILVSWRDTYKYEIDGIIVTHNKIYPRVEKNPEHAFAFKMVLTGQIAESKIIDVIWTASKDGYLKPKIRVEPIYLGGVKIEYATAFNARFVVDKKLGVGAIVKIIRSGDVIPYIMDVVTPASNVLLPDELYSWTDTNIDIVLEDTGSNATVLRKNITLFFTTLSVKGLSDGNVKRIMESGHMSVPAILKMSVSDFLNVDGFKIKMAENLYSSIQEKISSATISEFMTASNIFGRGFGKKKLDMIIKSIPNIFSKPSTPSAMVDQLTSVNGIAIKSAQLFVSKIDEFIAFMRECNLEHKLLVPIPSKIDTAPIPDTILSHILYGKRIVFTGVRDKQLISKLENIYNVTITTTIRNDTFCIVAKDPSGTSTKLKKGRDMNIPIYTVESFIAHMNI